jgi:hypothetical protein
MLYSYSIGPTKKMRMSSNGPDGKCGSLDEDQFSIASLSPQIRQQDDKILDHIIGV